jgi:general secretion pathway protein J
MKSVTLYAGRKRTEAGFTLLEMMLALAIFAGLSMAAIQLIQGGILSTEKTKHQSAELTKTQKLLWVLDQDLSQIIIRKSYIGSNKQLLNIRNKTSEESISIEFLRRSTVSDFGKNKSNGMINVEWLLKDRKLIRRSWGIGEKREDAGTDMLDDVTSFDVKFLFQGTDYTNPSAAEILIATPQFGLINYKVLLLEML